MDTSVPLRLFDSDDDQASKLGLVYSQTSDTPLRFKHKFTRLQKRKWRVMTAARIHDEETAREPVRYKCLMVTLTYSPGQRWRPNHITDFIKRVRQWRYRDKRAKLRYVWVLELTEKGVPHYHVLIWLPSNIVLPYPDKQGWWKFGCTKINDGRGKAGYLVKNSWDVSWLDDLPRGARLDGAGGHNHAGRLECMWWKCPRWVREIWGPEHRSKRCKGGGWMSQLTQEWRASPWKAKCIGTGVEMVPK